MMEYYTDKIASSSKTSNPLRHVKPWQITRNGVSKDKKNYTKNLNPVLWLFLKLVIEYHATYVRKWARQNKSKRPKSLELVADYIKVYTEKTLGFDEAKSQNFISRFRRFVWNRQVFRFEKKDVDTLCQVVPKLGEYDYWTDFSEAFGRNKLVQDGDSLTYTEFSELDPVDQDQAMLGASLLYSIYFLRLGKLLKKDSTTTSNIPSFLDPSSFNSSVNKVFDDIDESPEGKRKKKQSKVTLDKAPVEKTRKSKKINSEEMPKEEKNHLSGSLKSMKKPTMYLDLLGKYYGGAYKKKPAVDALFKHVDIVMKEHFSHVAAFTSKVVVEPEAKQEATMPRIGNTIKRGAFVNKINTVKDVSIPGVINTKVKEIVFGVQNPLSKAVLKSTVAMVGKVEVLGVNKATTKGAFINVINTGKGVAVEGVIHSLKKGMIYNSYKGSPGTIEKNDAIIDKKGRPVKNSNDGSSGIINSAGRKKSGWTAVSVLPKNEKGDADEEMNSAKA